MLYYKHNIAVANTKCTVQFLFHEARIRFRNAKYIVGSRENSGNS